MTERKIALFGGTFDPIHLGHTTVAAAAAQHIGAEKVIFIPTKRSPLKDSLPQASDDNRVKMIALAIKDNKNFELSDYELKRPAPSYTLETVRYFLSHYGGGTSLYWLAGADSVRELPYWYGITELIDICNLSVMFRAACDKPDFSDFSSLLGRARIAKLQENVIATPLVDISSTQIRNRLAAGRDVSDMLHPAVNRYIKKQGLYQPKPDFGSKT